MSPSGASAGRSRRSPETASQTKARSRPDALVVATSRWSSSPGREREDLDAGPRPVPQLGARFAAHRLGRQQAELETGRPVGGTEGHDRAVGAHGEWLQRGGRVVDGQELAGPAVIADDADPHREPVVGRGGERDPAAVTAERDVVRGIRRELGAQVDGIAATRRDGDPVTDLVAARVAQPDDPPPVGRESPDESAIGIERQLGQLAGRRVPAIQLGRATGIGRDTVRPLARRSRSC